MMSNVNYAEIKSGKDHFLQAKKSRPINIYFELENDLTMGDMGGAKITLLSAEDNGALYKCEILLTEGNDNIIIRNSNAIIIFQEVPSWKKYSCYLEIRDNVKTNNDGSLVWLMYNEEIDDRYSIEDIEEFKANL